MTGERMTLAVQVSKVAAEVAATVQAACREGAWDWVPELRAAYHMLDGTAQELHQLWLDDESQIRGQLRLGVELPDDLPF
jgi:hypothetical protein